MIFMDAPAHTRLRILCAAAFTPARSAALQAHIQDVADTLIDAMIRRDRIDVIADFADLLPATVTAELTGVPVEDRDRLKSWSEDFGPNAGKFPAPRGPGGAHVEDRRTDDGLLPRPDPRTGRKPREGVVHALMTAEIDGDRLSEEEVIANCIITMTGGQETTTNLIGNGLLSLFRNPDQMDRLIAEPSLVASAVEELLRYESPLQHAGRLAPADMELGGKQIRRRHVLLAVIGAAN
jgi:pimeloyl-[acyl-carrier protein] synthase